MIALSASERVRAWTDQIRTQGMEALWQRMTDAEREDFTAFARAFDEGFELELQHRWQEAADLYKTLSERHPAYSDISISRASFIVSDKINRAIRYYNQGVQAVEAKLLTKALQLFDLALNVDRNMEKALYNLGMTHKMLYVTDPVSGKHHRITALDTFKRLLDRNPAHARAAAQVEQLKRL